VCTRVTIVERFVSVKVAPLKGVSRGTRIGIASIRLIVVTEPP
jgi:hypothetical protein